MKATVIFSLGLVSRLVKGSLINETLFKLDDMSKLDFQIVVASAVFLDKDPHHIASLIKRAHELGLQTRHLKTMVLDHYLTESDDEKFRNFVKSLKAHDICNGNLIKESLICAGKKNSKPINNFLLKKGDTMKEKFIELSSLPIFTTDGDALISLLNQNLLLVCGELFSFERQIYKLFMYVIEGIDRISMIHLKSFLHKYKEFVKDVIKKNPVSIRSVHFIDENFLSKAQKTNLEGAKEIIRFLIEINPRACFFGDSTNALSQIEDLTLRKLVNQMNSRKVNDFNKYMNDISRKYVQNEIEAAKFLNQLKASKLPSTEHWVARRHQFWLFVAEFASQNKDMTVMAKDGEKISKIYDVLEELINDDEIKVRHSGPVTLFNRLMEKRAWVLLDKVLDLMNANGSILETSAIRGYFVFFNFFEVPKTLAQKIFKIIFKGTKLRKYQRFYFIGTCIDSNLDHYDVFKDIASALKINWFDELVVRSNLAQLGQPQTDFVKFKSSIKTMSEKNLFPSFYDRLKVEYLKCRFGRKLANPILDFNHFSDFLEYISVIDIAKFRMMNVNLTGSYIKILIGMLNSDQLTECIPGIAVRLAGSGLCDHLSRLIDVVSQLETIHVDIVQKIMSALMARVTRVAIDSNSFPIVRLILKLCTNIILGVPTMGIAACENMMDSLDSNHESLAQFKKTALFNAIKVIRYFIFSSDKPPTSHFTIPINFEYSSTEIMELILKA